MLFGLRRNSEVIYKVLVECYESVRFFFNLYVPFVR